MEDIISQTKAEYSRAKDRIVHALATTPDDKVQWSPSPTARTPIQQVAHAAIGTRGIGGLIAGKPFPFSSIAEMIAAMREEDKTYTTREQALASFNQASAEYLTWLDTLTPEQINSTIELPFGPMPMAAAITLPADHMRGHAAQLEYLQTIYGDLDLHIPS